MAAGKKVCELLHSAFPSCSGPDGADKDQKRANLGRMQTVPAMQIVDLSEADLNNNGQSKAKMDRSDSKMFQKLRN